MMDYLTRSNLLPMGTLMLLLVYVTIATGQQRDGQQRDGQHQGEQQQQSGGFTITTETPLSLNMSTVFAWRPSAWSECVYPGSGSGQRAPQCCSCHRKRNVTCLYKDRTMIVPTFYCHKLQTPRPKDSEPCENCVVNCAMSV